jgi:hypothetical protein
MKKWPTKRNQQGIPPGMLALKLNLSLPEKGIASINWINSLSRTDNTPTKLKRLLGPML